jgi:hypothetical protein
LLSVPPGSWGARTPFTGSNQWPERVDDRITEEPDRWVCALDAHGRSRFQLLQNALNKNARLLYVVFDAIFVGGKDMRAKPLLERKEILKALLPREPLLRFSEHWQAGVRQSTTSARRGSDRQACGGSLLLRRTYARVAQIQGFA